MCKKNRIKVSGNDLEIIHPRQDLNIFNVILILYSSIIRIGFVYFFNSETGSEAGSGICILLRIPIYFQVRRCIYPANENG